jgi:DNA polymerase III gamma/tau subunit
VVQALEKILKQEKVAFENDLLWHLGRRCEGSLRDCLSLLDQLLAFEPEKITLKGLQEILGLAPLERLQAWEKILQESKIEAVFDLVRQIQDGGIEAGIFLEQLQEHYQNILKASYGIIEGPSDVKEAYKGFSSLYQVDEILYILNRLDESLQNLKFSHHPRLHLEMTLLHLIQKPWKCTIDHLMNRLEAMKRELAQGSPSTTQSPFSPLSNPRPAAPASSTMAKTSALPSAPLPPPKEILKPASEKAFTPSGTASSDLAFPTTDSPSTVSSPIVSPGTVGQRPATTEKAAPAPSISIKAEPVAISAPPAMPNKPKAASPSAETSVSLSVTTTMAPGTFEGLVQFAALELGGHIR